ncbi:MAG: single-stranded-DNA-specific exonuclease RecJ, partial [Nitrospirae bacterium]
KEAALKKEKVLVFGDYDIDGITSTAIMLLTLKSMGINAYYYLPDRITEGYGFSVHGIKEAIKRRASLIITVDCGSSALKEIEEASSHGIDVIITDHHLPPETLPEALAVINPHRADSIYPFRELSGAGVAFKLSQALLGEKAEELIWLASIGTIGDLVPLLGENRTITYLGLKRINSTHSIPISALKESIGIYGDIDSSTLSYKIIPKLNAIGRFIRADKAVELFITHDINKARSIAQELGEINKKRRDLGEAIYYSALKKLEQYGIDGVIVLSCDTWHPGIIGIVASRLVEEFYRPTFLFAIDNGVARGSARSIPSFHLCEALNKCKDMLLSYGGHSQAAGIHIPSEKIECFREKMNNIIKESLRSEDLIPKIQLDITSTLDELNKNIAKEIMRLEPFGQSNHPPLIGAKNLEIMYASVVGSGHLKMGLRQNGVILDSIG